MKLFIKFFKNLFGYYYYNKIKNILLPKKINEDSVEIMNIRKLFYSQFVKSGDLCFDVGANIGNRISPLLMLNAQIVAIEPQISCQKILKSKYGNKIILVTEGLGEKEGIAEFYISDASTISSFSKDWIDSVKLGRFKEYSWKTKKEVRMTTLDILIHKYGIPAFIKIDVEGYELEVLKGLNKPVNMISFEYCVPEQIEKVLSCIKRLVVINPNIEFNYSSNETMQFALNKWVQLDKMINIINSKPFQNTFFGDIYVKTNTMNI